MSLENFSILEKLGKYALKICYLNSIFDSLLGQGTFSQVFRVKRKTDERIYALKKVSLEPLS